MTANHRKFLAGFGATAFAFTTLTPIAAWAAPPYDRPNAITCVYTGVFIEAPTSVPVTGPVLWQAEVQTYNTTTHQWERSYLSPHHSNIADQVYITAGPWADADNNPVYTILATIPEGTGPFETRVYNHFWRAVQGEWVYVDAGFFSSVDGTATGDQTCVLDGRPIVV